MYPNFPILNWMAPYGKVPKLAMNIIKMGKSPTPWIEDAGRSGSTLDTKFRFPTGKGGVFSDQKMLKNGPLAGPISTSSVSTMFIKYDLYLHY